jgi:hypothetical protein
VEIGELSDSIDPAKDATRLVIGAEAASIPLLIEVLVPVSLTIGPNRLVPLERGNTLLFAWRAQDSYFPSNSGFSTGIKRFSILGIVMGLGGIIA